ncbi:MAG: hypothetical protein JSW38_13225 [Dehalococcoidia bacterium]|nr:MAG: hypothetical protein JSW38_13225 [Dehalococcoidia bacterium]
MPVIKASVIHESKVRGRPIITRPEAEKFDGNIDDDTVIVCGNCETMLTDRLHLGVSIVSVVYQCPSCNSFNEF